MSDFLTGFAARLLAALLEAELIEIEPGSEAAVVAFVAGELAGAGQGAQAIASTARALVRCPQVVELFADDETLKDVIDAMAPGAR